MFDDGAEEGRSEGFLFLLGRGRGKAHSPERWIGRASEFRLRRVKDDSYQVSHHGQATKNQNILGAGAICDVT